VRGLSALPLGNDQSYPHRAVAPTIVATTPTLTSTAETAGLDLIAPPFTLLPDQGRAAPPKKTMLTPSFCKSNIQPRERLVAAHRHYIDANKSAWPAGVGNDLVRRQGRAGAGHPYEQGLLEPCGGTVFRARFPWRLYLDACRQASTSGSR
jgi:hypothetical protein